MPCTSGGAGARLVCGGGGAPPGVGMQLSAQAGQGLGGAAGDIGGVVSCGRVDFLQCPAACAAFALPSLPPAWGAPGVHDPALGRIASLCDSRQPVYRRAGDVRQ